MTPTIICLTPVRNEANQSGWLAEPHTASKEIKKILNNESKPLHYHHSPQQRSRAAQNY